MRRLLLLVTVPAMVGAFAAGAEDSVPVSKSVHVVQESGGTLSVPLTGAFVGRVGGEILIAGGLLSADVEDPLAPENLSDRCLAAKSGEGGQAEVQVLSNGAGRNCAGVGTTRSPSKSQ